MAEDGVPLLDQFFRTEGDRHVHTAEFPFHPGAAVQPDVGLSEPLLPFVFQLLDRFQHGLGADPVRSVRIGQVARHVDLVRAEPDDQFLDDVDVLLRARQFGHAAGLVERQVEEVCVGVVIQTE